MNNDYEVKALEKVRDKLTKKHGAVAVQLVALRAEYDLVMVEARDLSNQIRSINFSIASLKGDKAAARDSATAQDGVISVITELLSKDPHTLKQLQDAVEANGYSRHAVRKALAGIAFARTKEGLYTLRDHIYLEKQDELV